MKERKKLWGLFDRRPLIWFHYVLLVIALFLLHWIGNILFELDTKTWFYMFVFYYFGLSIADQIIHLIIGVD